MFPDIKPWVAIGVWGRSRRRVHGSSERAAYADAAYTGNV